jgi:uncharacterized phiE125 gp8 family phage protein
MMKAFAPSRTVAPVTALLSLEDAKAHLRVDTIDYDDYIAAMVAAATSYLDGYSGVLGCALQEQTWEQTLDSFPADRCLRIPLGKLVSVDSIAYFDGANAAQSFTGFHEATDAIGPMIILQDGQSWPTTFVRPDAVRVTWTCGYGADIPVAIIHAVKLLIGHWYANREAVITGTITAQLPISVAALIAPFRAVGT